MRGIIGDLELDGYSEKLRLAFEYQGEHHYKIVPRFRNTESDILETQKRDALKSKLCQENGILLIQIPFNVDLQTFIYQELTKAGIFFTPVSVVLSLKYPDKLGSLIEKATSLGGKLLSEQYISSSTALDWQCSKGHHWKACASSIKQGSWCPFCAGQIVTIEDMRSIAEKRGGKCVSLEYINARTKLDWLCANGHEFSVAPTHIKSGQWCRACVNQNKNR